MKHFFAALLCTFLSTFSLVQAQTLEKKWQFETIQNSEGKSLFETTESDFFNLNNGRFEYTLQAKDSLQASGNYMHQNQLLVLYYTHPKDTVRAYTITKLTDSTLVFSEKGVYYKFKSPTDELENLPVVKSNILPSEGFSMKSLWRGALGMVVLLFISFLLSKNRRAINWKTITFGLAAQLLLAIGVLKIPLIQMSFEFVGKIFVKILEFTQAGSTFLLGGMMDIESFVFIFLFQVLPTIIFFSALTSLLFYLGVIQVIVKGMAWILTKLLGISGAESLSVAGNIFLGQTEAPLMIKAYLEKMTKSEILLVMVGGMATVA